MKMYDIIEKKRNGDELTIEEIIFFIQGYTDDQIPDYQASALLMAIYFQGMTDEEQGHLTKAMVQSGDTIDLKDIKGIKVDKHSTGGVGDSVSIILGPLVASLGIPVPKMSGRGLGHTGGTLDKLEAIPGFNVEITNDEFIRLVNKNKVALIGQSSYLAPADKKIYSLRDVTATINSIPLIASSIMSKKIASGADAIVLDVKTGKGAFMENLAEAKKLANAMVAIGQQVGKETMAIISDMSQPLGYAIGNSLEIKEAIDTLQGRGPNDLTELCLAIGSQMVVMANKANNLEEARTLLHKNLLNGKAFDKFKVFLTAQNGNVKIANDPLLLPQATYQIDALSDTSGIVASINANEVGTAALMLGAGRITKDSVIDLATGVVLHKKVGDEVEKGEPLLTIHANKESITEVKDKLLNSIHITSKQVKKPTLIYEIIT